MITMPLASIQEEKDHDVLIYIFEEYQETMLKYAAYCLHVDYKKMAEDIVQEALISIAKNIKSIHKIPKKGLKKFLLCIIKNKAIDAVRYEKRREADFSLDNEEENFSSLVDDCNVMNLVTEQEGYDYIKQCIYRLNNKYRIVLELKLIFGFSNAEVASMLEITLKNVDVRIYRGKIKLREMLKNYKDEVKL